MSTLKLPHMISYALTVPALFGNLVILATMGYLASPAFHEHNTFQFHAPPLRLQP
ncbi:hypothetical protein DFH08DRAFT_970061 [Mycena albidolilacea]|uniref:Uncharacterized protein n=1 Tax=Mycena albidolilacea TaxID=1033008 RepID=A0AAD6ZHM4_9AGAR|nr:hypothetical protein DFH08DRAFT_970061 [Mycena albidolilacea]